MAKQQRPRQKHVPQRSCVVCRQTSDKRRLTRIVRLTPAADAPAAPDDDALHVIVDPTGKRNGRGAYLCDNPACWNRALDRNMLNVALKTELTAAEKAALRAAAQQHTRPQSAPVTPATQA